MKDPETGTDQGAKVNMNVVVSLGSRRNGGKRVQPLKQPIHLLSDVNLSLIETTHVKK